MLNKIKLEMDLPAARELRYLLEQQVFEANRQVIFWINMGDRPMANSAAEKEKMLAGICLDIALALLRNEDDNE